MTFHRIAILDWSAAKGPRLGRDSIWLGVAGPHATQCENIATRVQAEARLHALITEALAAGQRLLIGADFAFGYPAGFAAHLTGEPNALAVWNWLADRIEDAPGNVTNFRRIAAEINARFPGDGPFWGNGEAAQTPGLPRLKPALPPGLPAHRATDIAARGPGAAPKPVWQLAGAGAVGAQVMTGLPVLARLRSAFKGQIAVWPFEAADAPIVLAEVYPSILSAEAKAMQQAEGIVLDAAQVQVLAGAFFALQTRNGLAALFAPPAPEQHLEEGWILGAGAQHILRAALKPQITPPRPRENASSMPQGVEWVPVAEALARLRAALVPLATPETVTIAEAMGRVLAADVRALRANPPRANAAVDGYGFAHATTGHGVQRLPLTPGRAAAGQPFAGAVPPGTAIRILTGAILPEGVDCVVMQEDCALDGAAVLFDGPVKPRANTRAAGEDMATGAQALPQGHLCRPPDLALLAALGVAQVPVLRRLRVGVLSTGDEIIPEPGLPALPHQIYDANRPMLLAMAARWGYAPVDLGHVQDNPGLIARRLDQASRKVDVILTSGGASAGDEDHVSTLMRSKGTLSSWRIAMKPGRPLVLAFWNGVPVLGLPGNPVAAFVCTLIFARPALSLLAGAGWPEPQAYMVPAAFRKTKKPGRREYLRARLDAAGHAEVFASEGSGRISGLAWATGIVELPDGAVDIREGDPVCFLPYGSFGL